MSTADTSKASWKSIVTSGVLGEKQRLAYWMLEKFGPGTENEIRHRAQLAGTTEFETLDNLHKRLPELREVGVVASDTKATCSITGKTCYVWSIATSTSVKQPKSTKPYSGPWYYVLQEPETVSGVAGDWPNVITRLSSQGCLKKLSPEECHKIKRILKS